MFVFHEKFTTVGFPIVQLPWDPIPSCSTSVVLPEALSGDIKDGTRIRSDNRLTGKRCLQ